MLLKCVLKPLNLLQIIKYLPHLVVFLVLYLQNYLLRIAEYVLFAANDLANVATI